MTLEAFLRVIAEALAAERIPAMLTGSVAAAFRSAARATTDVDLVIEPTANGLERFLERVAEIGYDARPEAAREALATHPLFNVIDPEGGWKADLIIRKSRSFSQTEIARLEAVAFLGVPVSVARIEDLILAKLDWAALGASSRQLEDVRQLLRIGGDDVDLRCIDRWVHELDVTAVWDVLRHSADCAAPRAEARFINHSCDPNCDAVIEDGRIWIDSARDIVAGEELAYDYGYELKERHSPAAKRRYPCSCGAATCRGTILAKKRSGGVLALPEGRSGRSERSS